MRADYATFSAPRLRMLLSLLSYAAMMMLDAADAAIADAFDADAAIAITLMLHYYAYVDTPLLIAPPCHDTRAAATLMMIRFHYADACYAR